MEYLREPTSTKTAEQCRQMGIAVGDVIEGRETYSTGGFSEARLELLWLGDDVAVFRQTRRSDRKPEWSKPDEEACWTLDCRRWRKVTPNVESSGTPAASSPEAPLERRVGQQED